MATDVASQADLEPVGESPGVYNRRLDQLFDRRANSLFDAAEVTQERMFGRQHEVVSGCQHFHRHGIANILEYGSIITTSENGRNTVNSRIVLMYLHMACPQADFGDIAHAFIDAGFKWNTRRNAWRTAVITFHDPSPKMLMVAIDLLATRMLRSAAVTSDDLSEITVWIATEWAHCLVVQSDQALILRGMPYPLVPRLASTGGLLIFDIDEPRNSSSAMS